MRDRALHPSSVPVPSCAVRESERAALARLRRLGGEGLASELAALYLADTPGRLAAARDAIRRGDGAALAAAVHAVKSSSAQLGADRLAAVCEDAEMAAEAGALTRAAHVLVAVEIECAAFATRLATSTGTSVPAPIADAAVPAPAGGSQRQVIAVIEDNVDNRLLVDAILGDRFDLDEYATGAAALAGMAQRVPDLVLLDVSLPGMDGLEVLSRIRLEQALAGVPVVALTAHAMAGDRERYLAAGFDDYVPKPIVDERVLVSAIERLLGEARAREGIDRGGGAGS